MNTLLNSSLLHSLETFSGLRKWKQAIKENAMQIKISLTRDEVNAILADHFRKLIPDLQEVKSGVAAETVVVVVVKDEANRK